MDAAQIMARAVEYSKWEATQIDSNRVTYSKYILTEQLDSDDVVKKQTEESFVVEFKSDNIKVRMQNGQSSDSAGPPSRREDKPIHLNPDIISRFDFVLVERLTLNNRESYLLAFAPKDNLEESGLTERFLNKIAGWIWVDAGDFAVAQARIRILSPVTLWGGMLGALKDFSYEVDRTRLNHGFWFNQTSRSSFHLRKFLVSKRFRTLSRWTDVQVHPPAKPANPPPGGTTTDPNPKQAR